MSSESKNEIFTQIILEVFKAGGVLNTEGDKMTKEFGLTASRWKILGAVKLSGTPLTVPEIGRYMGQSRQAIQRLVDVMTKDGLLDQIDNPNHKRAKNVQLTGKAEMIYQKLDLKQIDWATKLSENLTKSDLEKTLHVLKHISDQAPP